MTPGSAFRLELFASLVCCFLSARISYVTSSGFSLETVVALLREGYTVKLGKVERPNKKTANVKMPRTVEKSCGPVNPIQ